MSIWIRARVDCTVDAEVLSKLSKEHDIYMEWEHNREELSKDETGALTQSLIRYYQKRNEVIE